MSEVVTRADVVLKAAAAFDELINWLNLLGIQWWMHEGWSVRKVGQEELHGSRGENREPQHSPGGVVAAEVAPGVDDGVSGRGPAVETQRAIARALAKVALGRAPSSSRRRPAPRRRRMRR